MFVSQEKMIMLESISFVRTNSSFFDAIGLNNLMELCTSAMQVGFGGKVGCLARYIDILIAEQLLLLHLVKPATDENIISDKIIFFEL